MADEEFYFYIIDYLCESRNKINLAVSLKWTRLI